MISSDELLSLGRLLSPLWRRRKNEVYPVNKIRSRFERLRSRNNCSARERPLHLGETNIQRRLRHCPGLTLASPTSSQPPNNSTHNYMHQSHMQPYTQYPAMIVRLARHGTANVHRRSQVTDLTRLSSNRGSDGASSRLLAADCYDSPFAAVCRASFIRALA